MSCGVTKVRRAWPASPARGVNARYNIEVSDASQQRGIWAERYVQDFLSLPFVSEFVCRSPQTLDGTQKEVADFLITYPGVGVLISQKTQDDPLSRVGQKTASWALKQSKKAASQLCGALRTGRGKPAWCEHPRRGRVELPNGLPVISHGLVLTEVFERVDLNADADDLPLHYQGVPITYFSLNDFLNVAMELRTLPEILAYLDARRSLPYTDLRTIGDEFRLYEFYLLHNGSLAGCLGKADAAVTVAARRQELKGILQSKWEDDFYGGLIEHVADQLATRQTDYATGLSADALAQYDAPDNRSNYLRMQAVLADLRLRERSALGRAFEETAQHREQSGGDFTHRAIYIDGRPEWVYVLASCKGIAPALLIERMNILAVAAMAHFRKTHCLVVVDREGAGYQVGLTIRPSAPSSPIERSLGDEYYGRLRMTDKALSLIPA